MAAKVKAKKFKLGPIQKKWVRALRSGKYKQGDGQLVTTDDEGKPVSYCCLGVLCDIAAKEKITKMRLGDDLAIRYDRQISFLPLKVQKWAAVAELKGKFVDSDGDFGNLAQLNDDGCTFRDIAKVIEDNAASIFTESR